MYVRDIIMERQKIVVGRKYKNISGLEFEICELILGTSRCKVRFIETGSIEICERKNLSAGKVKDRMATVSNGTTLGGSVNTQDERVLWKNMISRCNNHEAYKDVSVCDRWLCLENFVTDVRTMDNYNNWKVDTSGWQLDKDIKYAGNKIYSKQSCLFVRKELNNLFKSIRSTGKTYVATHEDGTHVTFVNQRKFASEYGLCYQNIPRAIKTGGTTKGWRITEVE